MTPEESMPDSIDVAILINQEAIDKGEKPPLWFTAKETAEIAKAYASALHASEFNSADAAKDAAQWEKRFEEWSK